MVPKFRGSCTRWLSCLFPWDGAHVLMTLDTGIGEKVGNSLACLLLELFSPFLLHWSTLTVLRTVMALLPARPDGVFFHL